MIETLKRLKHFDSVLIYNTSLCTLEYQDRSVLEDLRDFNNLIFYVSIDGIKEHFNYIREGHDWNLLEKNLETLREQLSHAQIKIAITVSLYNVFWLPEIIDELLKKAQPNQFIFNLVYTPQVFNPMILTTEDKVFIKNKYYRYIKNLLLRMDYIDAVFLISPLKMLIHYIFSGDSDLSSLEEFKNLHLNDQKRFKELFPEYAHLFE